MKRLFARLDVGLLLVILLSGFAAMPLLLQPQGLPNGSDVLYHAYRAAMMDRAWTLGDIFPRWADALYYGYGAPLWHFYAPLSYYLTSLMSRLFALDALGAIRAVVLLSYFGMGIGMYFFSKRTAGRLAGVLAAIQIGLRFVVVLTAVNGFTSTVDIPQVGGLLERFGLRGLGFSLGVALNLLPGLQQSSHNAWQALQMRGGLRRRWWRGLRLLAMTVMTNALRRAEEIALAAESRAFSPECVRPMPLHSGWQDKLLFPVGLFVLLWMALG